MHIIAYLTWNRHMINCLPVSLYMTGLENQFWQISVYFDWSISKIFVMKQPWIASQLQYEWTNEIVFHNSKFKSHCLEEWTKILTFWYWPSQIFLSFIYFNPCVMFSDFAIFLSFDLWFWIYGCPNFWHIFVDFPKIHL